MSDAALSKRVTRLEKIVHALQLVIGQPRQLDKASVNKDNRADQESQSSLKDPSEAHQKTTKVSTTVLSPSNTWTARAYSKRL